MLIVFFFNDAATTEIYTLSLHDALPICPAATTVRPTPAPRAQSSAVEIRTPTGHRPRPQATVNDGQVDRKSTRLNSSHLGISYAVFCLKKKITAEDRSREKSTSGVGEAL